MPGKALGNHASPILLLILKMSVLRIAIFRILEDSLPFALIQKNRSKVLHDAVPFCEVLFLVSDASIAYETAFVIQPVV